MIVEIRYLIFAKSEYPLPIYKIDGDKAYCVKGVYAEELFKIARDTVFKARGLF